MNTERGLERCQAFINCQAQPMLGSHNGEKRLAVTISRQTGSGGHVVAERLAEYLQAASPKQVCPWTVFDRNLVEKVLEQHHLPESLARFMAEDRISEIADTMDELFGLHPPSWTLVRQTADTILHLAELGNVILLGRGANVITARLPYVFNVRLVGSLARRIQRLEADAGLTTRAARAFIELEDRGRRRYLKKYFDKDISDPLLYHLVLNTDLVSCEQAARIIGNAVLGMGRRGLVPGGREVELLNR